MEPKAPPPFQSKFLNTVSDHPPKNPHNLSHIFQSILLSPVFFVVISHSIFFTIKNSHTCIGQYTVRPILCYGFNALTLSPRRDQESPSSTLLPVRPPSWKTVTLTLLSSRSRNGNRILEVGKHPWRFLDVGTYKSSLFSEGTWSEENRSSMIMGSHVNLQGCNNIKLNIHWGTPLSSLTWLAGRSTASIGNNGNTSAFMLDFLLSC